MTVEALMVLLQDGREAGLIRLLELAGRLERLLLFEEVLGRGNSVVELGTLPL